ncbi:6977_t:CDS:1 [Paraglomus occultum]|uniref:6977_t:CDS:1 n=1 Tax=Paraglomus occultum TaxID=144539 RepID=A0A9N8Z464_9GLOM|nr:6977_t:CDS:1 [Paraglomus occultum]
MSEDSEVLKIYNALVDKHNFSAELLKFKPNTKDSKAISNQSIRQILSKASKAKTGELGKLDIYYCSEEEKFLFLVEVKEKTSQQKKAIEDIQHYLSFFEELSIDYKVVGLAISGNISEEDNFKIATFTIKEKKITLVKRLENFLASKEKYLDLFVVKKNNVDKETDENKIISLARDTSRLLRELGGNDKPMVVAGALITLCKPIKKEKYIRSKIRGIISKYKETLQKGEELLENEEIEIIGQEIKSNFLKEGKADKEEEHSDLIRVLKESLSDAQRDKKVKTVNDSIV